MNKNIEDGGLYTLLSTCNNEELNPLVDVLTNAATSSLKKSTLFKRNNPNHSKYSDLVGDEIRLFGGDSVVNFFRNEGVSYDEIVANVCKELLIPYKNGETIDNENTILNFFEIEHATVNRKNIDAFVKKHLLIGNIKPTLNPFKKGVKPVTGVAFRITIPCVLYVATLRKMKLTDSNIKSTEVVFRSSKSRENLLTIENSNKELVLSLKELSNPIESMDWQDIQPEKDDKISQLNHLFQAVPSLVSAHNVKSTQYMEVVVNGTLASADGGGFRGFVLGDKGITEQAKLFNPEKLSQLVNTSALFQVASTAVAQKHLADISAKLSDIKASVDKIERFQENHRESIILGAIKYFEQVAPSVIGGELSDSVLNQIEAKEADLLAHQLHLVKDIKSLVNKSKIDDSDSFGSEGLMKKIDEHRKNIHSNFTLLLLCLRARACGWQLLSAYSENNSLLDNRYEDINKDILALKADLFNEAKESIRIHISTMSAFCNTDKTLNERKLNLINKNNQTFVDIMNNNNSIVSELSTAKRLTEEAHRPERTMFVKLKDNTVLAAAV